MFGLQTKLESYDDAMAHVLESFGISELETEHKLILDDLRESKDCIGITSKTLTKE